MTFSKDGPGILLVDEKGKIRTSLAIDEGEVGLNMFDDKGKRRVWLGMSDKGSGISLYDNKVNQRVDLCYIAEGPRLHLNDQDGNPPATMVLLEAGLLHDFFVDLIMIKLPKVYFVNENINFSHPFYLLPIW